MQSCRRSQGLRGAVADAGAPLACRTTFERAGVGLQLWIRGDDVKNGRSRRSGGGVFEGLCGIEGALASTSDGGLAGLVVWLDGWMAGWMAWFEWAGRFEKNRRLHVLLHR